jgi:hypothetical protein
MAIGGGWLRIRRPQVRVLPSAPEQAPQIAGFCICPDRRLAALTTYLTTYPYEKRLEKRPKASAWMCGMTCA